MNDFSSTNYSFVRKTTKIVSSISMVADSDVDHEVAIHSWGKMWANMDNDDDNRLYSRFWVSDYTLQ